MNVLERALAKPTGRAKHRYLSAKCIQKRNPDLAFLDDPINDEYCLTLDLSVLFTVPRGDDGRRFNVALQCAQENMLRVIYGDLHQLVYDLELAIHDEEMKEIIMKIREEVGI